MKHFYTLLLLLVSTATFAQIPTGYYNTATGTGYTLKTQLYNIIDNHDDQGYNAMDGFISSYDRDVYYDESIMNPASGSYTILDIYSEIPNPTNDTPNDPYNYIPTSDECGNYNSEGDCYNKEHVIPQSVYNEATPMRSDAHILLPTDGRVNGFRSNYPFGQVDDNNLVNQSGISNPTQNGSKLGGNLNSGYSAGYTGTVFEPIDEFKGDIARIYFYFVTRYQNQIDNWGAYAMFDGSSDKVLDDPFLNILITWHNADPVSQKEIDRNNNIYYNHQLNRNPFVDHPEWVAQIWDPTPDTEAPTDPTNLMASNPTDNTIDLSWTASTDNIAVTSYDIYVDGTNSFNATTNSFTVTGLTADTEYCFTIKAKDATGNESGFSNQACETTTDNGVGVTCLAESFENIPTNNGSYQTRNWTGDDGGEWVATDARTDQTLDNRAITIRDGSLTAPTTSGGIANLTVSTKRVFGGSSGTFNLKVNNNVVGTIAYGDQDVVQTITIPNINIEGNVTIVIDGNSESGNRVVFDDLSWTCFTELNVNDYQLNDISIYPNPVSNILNIQLKNSRETQIEIYNILGKRVFSRTIQQSQSIQLDNLNSGVYILKLTQNNSIISKKLIKR
jgi:endonuclease I/chitodextrinase